jgi:uncharacterized membrane protein
MRRALAYLVLSTVPITVAAVQGPQTIDLPADTSLADATDINARGDAVGWLFHPTEPCPPDASCSASQSFIAPRGGTPILFTVPGALATFASGINAAGDIVGQYSDAAGVTHGFLRTPDGQFSTIDFPGEPLTTITGINSFGTMVGYYVHNLEEEEAPAKGFVLDRSGFHVLPQPDIRPRAIADDGTIVGSMSDVEQHSFVLQQGIVRRFDCAGAVFTDLHDVLANGTMVGVMLTDFTSPIQGFIVRDGGCEPLGAGVWPEGINQRGTIVGQIFSAVRDRGGAFIWRR